MRTTIDLPDPLFRELKTRAAQQGDKLKDLVAKYIETGLRGPSGAIGSSPRARRPLPTAIARDSNFIPAPALTNRDLSAILEAEDLASHKRILQLPPGDQ